MFDPGGLDPGWSGTTRAPATVTSVTIRYRLVISGSLPRTTRDLLDSRFRPDQVETVPASTAVTVTVVDQPALRALLGLIWDTGRQVVSVRTEPLPPALPDEGEPR